MGAPFYSPEYHSAMYKLKLGLRHNNPLRGRTELTQAESAAVLDICESFAELFERVEWAGHE